MSRTLPTTVVSAVTAEATGAVFLVLLSATHTSFDAPIRIVNNTEDVVSNGVTYLARPFSLIMPPDADDLQPRAVLTASNVTLEFIDELRAVAGSRERISVDLRVVSSDDPDTVLQAAEDLEAVSVDYNAETFRLELTYASYITEPFPAGTFAPSGFPGIF